MEFVEVSFTDVLMSKAIWAAILTSVAIAFVMSFASFIPTTKNAPSDGAEQRHSFRLFLIVILAFSLLGFTSGQMMGQSRDPAIGDVLPAVLALISGLFIYLISKENNDLQLITATSIISLVLCLMLGTQWGAQLRYEFETNQKVMAQYNKTVDTALREAEIQHAVNLQKLLYKKDILDLSQELGLVQPPTEK